MGSRGSVIPFFMSLKMRIKYLYRYKHDSFHEFTKSRSRISLACFNMIGGEIYVKKYLQLKNYIAKVINPKAKYIITGIRPGEKLHEQMISEDDSFSTYEYSNYYKIYLRLTNGEK